MSSYIFTFLGLPSLETSNILGYEYDILGLYGNDKHGNVIKQYLDDTIKYIKNGDWNYFQRSNTDPIPLTNIFSKLDTYRSSDGYYLSNPEGMMGENTTVNLLDHKGKK